jgi:ABC-type Fe3+ transport system substrate-binding protein
MEGRAGWFRHHQSSIEFDLLTGMVAELVAVFELQQAHETAGEGPDVTDWVSPTGLTRVIRYGSSAQLRSVLMQAAGAVSAEYEVLHCGNKAFSWRDYLWPSLQASDSLLYPTGQVAIAASCLQELMQFHEKHATSWQRRYLASVAQAVSASDNCIKIDKIGVVAQPDRVQLL